MSGGQVDLATASTSIPPAPPADLALIKAIAQGRKWADDLLAGRVESVAAIAKREGVLPELRPPTDTVGGLGLQDCRGHRLRVTNRLPQEAPCGAKSSRCRLPYRWTGQFRARIGFAGFSGIAPQETLSGCMRERESHARISIDSPKPAKIDGLNRGAQGILNPRPLRCERSALPAELPHRRNGLADGAV
jgi:hypothetical protein